MTTLFGRLVIIFHVLAFSLQIVGLSVSAIEHDDVADKHIMVSQMDIARNMIKAYVGESKASRKDMSKVSKEIENLFKDQFSSQVVEDLMGEMEEDDSEHHYADRFVRGMLDVISDPDCMTREFDANDEDFDVQDAAQVFQKCKLLVIRNAFDMDFLHEYKKDFTDYIQAIHRGHISSKGKTTNGEGYFLQKIDHKRWEVLVMEAFAHPDLLANDNVISILSDPRILGSRRVLHSFGSALAEPGAHGQRWHTDDPYLFGTDSFLNNGVGGHDLPSYATTMMVPMLNMTSDHGPTEFCMGTSFLVGFNKHDVEIKDSLLRKEYNDYLEHLHHLQLKEGCPEKSWRSPQLRFGDMLLFDYQIRHRGGPNHSPDMRAVMYMTYSRRWYKDGNFERDMDESKDDEEEDEEAKEFKEMLVPARFAIPDEVSEDYYTMEFDSRLEDIKALFESVENQ